MSHDARITSSPAAETLDALLKARDWLSAIPFVESFTVDTTQLTPAEAARAIAEHFQLESAL